MKRKVRWILLLLIAFAAFVVWLEPTRVVWGWLCGEEFYRGRPTSYWRRQFLQWEKVPIPVLDSPRPAHWRWNPSWMSQKLEDKKGYTTDFPLPFGKDVDPAAAPLLRELLDDPSPVVRDVARACLERLTRQAAPP